MSVECLAELTTTTNHVAMSTKKARKNAEIAGGEKVAKQRPLRRRIRDTARLLSRVSLLEIDCVQLGWNFVPYQIKAIECPILSAQMSGWEKLD